MAQVVGKAAPSWQPGSTRCDLQRFGKHLLDFPSSQRASATALQNDVVGNVGFGCGQTPEESSALLAVTVSSLAVQEAGHNAVVNGIG